MEEQVLRTKKVIAYCGVSRTFIWRGEKAGTFPKRVKLGARAVGWLKSDLDAWLRSLKNQGANPNSPQDGQ